MLGVPLGTALGHVAGWRPAMAAVGVAAAISAVALRRVLPALPAEAAGATGTLRARVRAIPAALRSAPLLVICVVTVLVVTGHFTAYTYITELIRRDAGLTGLALSAVLFGYGAAGIAGIWLAGRVTDSRPRRAAAACAVGVAVALAGLLTARSAAATVTAVILWGAAFTALPVTGQAAVLRVAPRSADTASALYVVAFQIGIGGGALAGALLVDAGLLSALCVVGVALAGSRPAGHAGGAPGVPRGDGAGWRIGWSPCAAGSP